MRLLRDDTELADQAAILVKVLAHPSRLRLVAALCEQEADATGLAARLGLGAPQVTRLLQPLLAHRLIAVVPGHGAPRYRVAAPALHGLVACMEDCAR
jgi:ArsR family transcriptional regulator